MIKVTNLIKNYYKEKNKVSVLKGLTFTIDKGDFISITGPSGSGKSTLLYTLSGLEDYEGSIKIENLEVKDLTKNQKSLLRQNKIGFVFQFFNLIDHLSVYDNLKLAYVISNNKGFSIDEVLQLVNMENYASYFPFELSGGQQQKIAIARALLGNKNIILADEPTGNLDYASSIEVMELFKTINQKLKITILLVTHNDLLLKYVDKTIKIKDGKIDE